MKVTYVTMQFPVPSETFASLDVSTLLDLGCSITIKSLRFKHANYDEMVRDRGHKKLKISHFSIKKFFTSLFLICENLNLCSKLFLDLFKSCWLSPKHLIKSLVIFPSAITAFKEIELDRPDVVHLFWGHYPSLVGLLYTYKYPDRPLTMFLGAHDLVENYPLSSVLSKKARFVTTHSKANLPSIVNMGIDINKIHVIHRGIKVSEPLINNELSSASLHKLTLLTAARLIEEKGVDDVIDILHSLVSKDYDAILYIAGDGPYKAELMRQIKSFDIEDRVIFLGHISQQELQQRMSMSTFFLLMSRYDSERLPNVVKEAMYQRSFVITTDTVGIDELITTGVDGYVVPKGEREEALEILISNISDQENYNLLRNNAYEKIINNFDVRVSMNKYMNLWKSSCL